MKNISIVQWLRFAGMMAWLMYTLGFVVMWLNQPELAAQASDTAATAGEIARLVSLLLFGIGYWFNMRDIPVNRPSGRQYGLLAVQIVSAMGVAMFVGDAGLMYVVAAETPLVLKRGQAARWMAAQLALSLR